MNGMSLYDSTSKFAIVELELEKKCREQWCVICFIVVIGVLLRQITHRRTREDTNAGKQMLTKLYYMMEQRKGRESGSAYGL